MENKNLSFSEAQELIRQKEEELKKLKHFYSNSNTKNSVNTNRSTIYVKQVSDLHASNLDKLVDEVTSFLKIPGAYIILNGDLINGDIPAKKNVNIFGKVQSPQDELFSVISAIKKAVIESGEDPHKVFVACVDGNHDLRITDMTSIQPGNIMTNIIGVPEIYSENLSEIVFNLNDAYDPNKQIGCTATISHGNQMPHNPGNALDIALVKTPVKGANIVFYGHTHIPAFGTMTSKINDKGVEKTIETVAFNPGSEQPRENYVDKNGYGLCGRPDGEIVRISAVPNEATKTTKISIDMINQRQIYDADNKTWIEVNRIIDEVEDRNFENKKELDKAYKQVVPVVLKVVNNGNRFKARARMNEMALSILSGFVTGNPQVDNEEKIQKAIKAISAVYNCKVVLNGDMLFYHEASTFREKKKARYPEDSFAYIELLAQQLEPIKNKIIAYNSGIEETKIMKYHGDELAKYAMNTLQMDEKLVYKPYNKVQYQAEQLKVQAKMVEEYNKKTLKDECSLYQNSAFRMKEFEVFYKEKYGDKKFSEQAKEDIFKDYVAQRLRKEDRLLTLGDKAKINEKFPLSDIDLRVPHENLIQHILFTKLNVNIKNIEINTKYNTQTKNKVRLYTQMGNSSPMFISGLYSTSNASRGAQENNMNRVENTNPGYDIYYVTPKKNCEYMTKGTTAYVIDGKTTLKTIYHICAPRFDSKKYVENIDSENRMYIFKKIPKNKYMVEAERTGRSAFLDESEDDYTIIGSSVSYDSLLVQDDVKTDIVKKELSLSYKKKLQEINERKSKADVENIMDTFDKNVDKVKNKFDNAKEKKKLIKLNAQKEQKVEVEEKTDMIN